MCPSLGVYAFDSKPAGLNFRIWPFFDLQRMKSVAHIVYQKISHHDLLIPKLPDHLAWHRRSVATEKWMYQLSHFPQLWSGTNTPPYKRKTHKRGTQLPFLEDCFQCTETQTGWLWTVTPKLNKWGKRQNYTKKVGDYLLNISSSRCVHKSLTEARVWLRPAVCLK